VFCFQGANQYSLGGTEDKTLKFSVRVADFSVEIRTIYLMNSHLELYCYGARIAKLYSAGLRAGCRGFESRHHVHTGSGVHPAS
jgi:hypothetical protein